MRSTAVRLAVALFLVSALVSAAFVPSAAAQSGTQTAAPGPSMLATAYPSVRVDENKLVTFSVELHNNSAVGRMYNLEIVRKPEGWETALKAMGMGISRVFVAAGKSQSFDFQVRPPQNAKGQTGEFELRAVSTDGAEDLRLPLTVTYGEGLPGATRLLTQYPRLAGQSGNKFSFKLDLVNEASEERLFSLSANAPQGWTVSFKPAYESTQISSIRMKPNETKGIDVEVQTPERAAPGAYEIQVLATAGADRAQQTLTVQLSGVHKIALSTQSGLLNTSATAGESRVVTLVVDNTGGANLQNVTLSSTKPDGWDVTFAPDKIDTVPAGGSREVQMTIKPSNKAIAGDYLLRVTASTPQTSDTKEIRVTVETPTAWGLVGAGIVVLAVGGLFSIFRKFGRR
jgi:uncharacterized membrane protein